LAGERVANFLLKRMLVLTWADNRLLDVNPLTATPQTRLTGPFIANLLIFYFGGFANHLIRVIIPLMLLVGKFI
jgi:hypothetical protein